MIRETCPFPIPGLVNLASKIPHKMITWIWIWQHISATVTFIFCHFHKKLRICAFHHFSIYEQLTGLPHFITNRIVLVVEFMSVFLELHYIIGRPGELITAGRNYIASAALLENMSILLLHPCFLSRSPLANPRYFYFLRFLTQMRPCSLKLHYSTTLLT